MWKRTNGCYYCWVHSVWIWKSIFSSTELSFSLLLLLAFLFAISVFFLPQFSSLFYGLFVPWSVFLFYCGSGSLSLRFSLVYLRFVGWLSAETRNVRGRFSWLFGWGLCVVWSCISVLPLVANCPPSDAQYSAACSAHWNPVREFKSSHDRRMEDRWSTLSHLSAEHPSKQLVCLFTGLFENLSPRRASIIRQFSICYFSPLNF